MKKHNPFFLPMLRMSVVLQLLLLCAMTFTGINSLSAQCQTCCNGSKPKSLVLIYNAKSCSETVTCQASGKWSCTESNGGLNNLSSVYIVASKNSDGTGGTYFAGTVNLNGEFTANAAAGGSSTFPSNTYFLVYNQQGGTLRQRVQIHTSCSTPLVAGDQIGSLVLKTITLADNTVCNSTPPTPVCPGITCGGEIMDSEVKCGPFDPEIITEATPPCVPGGNPICFKIDPPVSGSQNGATYTVTTQNGEAKTLTVTGSNVIKVVVKGGPGSVMYTNSPFTNLTAPINPNNGQPYGISHFTICINNTPPPPATDCCDGSKPKSSILLYTGQGCSASNTTQPLGNKYNCTDFGGGPNGDPSVYITASKNSDGTGGTFFAGTVAINTTFTINAASGGASTFPSNVFFNIYASQGGTLLQRVQIHYSCSAPLVPGEQFGSLVLKGVTFADNTTCGEGSTGGGGTGGTDCCDGSKPKTSVLLYTGQGCSASNTTQPLGNKYNCTDFGGGPNGDPSVYITASKNSDGTGGTFFAGTVAINNTFTINAASGGASTFPSNVYFNIYASQGGTLLQRVQIHYSCSAPLVPGEQFGSLVLQSVTFADNKVCGLQPPQTGGGFEYRWLRSTTGCPTSLTQVIAGATSISYDPGQITQTTWYVRLVRRIGCTSDNDWVASNCIIKRVVNINSAVSDIVCDNKGTSDPGDDTFTFKLTVNGSGSEGWSAVIGGQTVNGNYGTSVNLGPFLISGGTLSFDVIDKGLNSCKANQVVVPPANCSPQLAKAALGDRVWNDLNKNGVQDPNETGGVANVTVKLYKCDNTFVNQTTTNANGNYLFTNLDPNMQYYVEFSNLPAGFQFTLQNIGDDGLDSDVNPQNGRTACTFLSPGEDDRTWDAGVFVPAACQVNITISNKLCNNNGTPNNPNDDTYTFTLLVTGSNTSNDWFASYSHPCAGVAVVGPVAYNTPVTLGPFPAGPVSCGNTFPPLSYPNGFDIDVSVSDSQDPSCNKNTTVTSPGPCSVPQLGSIGDFVWVDNNQNGIQDIGEPGIGGVTVQLKNCNNTVLQTTSTAPNGSYLFSGLAAGCYRVGVVLPSNYQFSPQDQGVNDALDSDINPGTAMTGDINLAAGQNNLTIDAGIYKPATTGPGKVGDFVWFDANGNGIQDPNEPGIPGVFVFLETCSGNSLGYVITGPNGMYMFNDVPAGSYRVKFAHPGKYNGINVQFTTQDAGNDDTKDSDPNWLGLTGCFTLGQGESNLTIDAGLKGETPTPVCVINGSVSNIICSDNGTPNNPNDDTYKFTLVVNGSNTGAWGFDIQQTGQMMLAFGTPHVIGPFPISAGPLTLNLCDHDVLGCCTTVSVTPPQTCSNGGPACNNVTNGGGIGNDETSCIAYDPANIVSLALPSGGSGTIEYMWLKSTAGCPDNVSQAIAGATGASYDPPSISVTTWYVRLSRRSGCTQWVPSNCVKKEVKDCGGGSGCPIVIATSNNTITVSGLNAPNVSILVFNSQWATSFSCDNWTTPCNTPQQVIGNLPAGTYFVKVFLNAANHDLICKEEKFVNVPGTYIVIPGDEDGSESAGTTDKIHSENGEVANQLEAISINERNGGASDETIAETFAASLLPNPAKGSVTVLWQQAEAGQAMEITLMNQLGQQVKTIRLDDAAAGNHSIDLTDLREGQYIVFIRLEGKTPVVKKLMVVR